MVLDNEQKCPHDDDDKIDDVDGAGNELAAKTDGAPSAASTVVSAELPIVDAQSERFCLTPAQDNNHERSGPSTETKAEEPRVNNAVAAARAAWAAANEQDAARWERLEELNGGVDMGSARRIGRRPSVSEDFVSIAQTFQPEPETRETLASRMCSRSMLKPSSPIRLIWDLTSAISLCYVAIVLPFRMGFDVDARGNWFSLELYIDIFFCADVLLNFRTGYISNSGKEVMEWKAVFANYLRTWFLIDLVSSVPFDLSFSTRAAGAVGSARLLRAGKALRVMKMFRLSKLFKITANASVYTEQAEEFVASWSLHWVLTLSKLAVVLMFTSHVIACCWAYATALGNQSWLDTFSDGEPVSGTVDDDEILVFPPASEWLLERRYLACLYWALASITTVGYGDIVPHSDEERIVAMVALLVGTGFYSYVIGSISSIVASTDSTQRTYLEKMDLIYSYMKHRRFPPNLRRKVARYFKKYFEFKTALNEEAILAELDPELRHEVGLFLCHEAVANNWLLSGLPKGALLKLSTALKPLSVSKNANIFQAGDQGTEMFFLLNGELAILAGDIAETVIRTISSGSSFGEPAAFGISSKRTATVRAIVPSELYRLSGENLRTAFRDSPGVYDEMRQKVVFSLVGSDGTERLGGVIKQGSFALDIMEDLEKRKANGSAEAASTMVDIISTIKRVGTAASPPSHHDKRAVAPSKPSEEMPLDSRIRRTGETATLSPAAIPNHSSVVFDNQSKQRRTRRLSWAEMEVKTENHRLQSQTLLSGRAPSSSPTAARSLASPQVMNPTESVPNGRLDKLDKKMQRLDSKMNELIDIVHQALGVERQILHIEDEDEDKDEEVQPSASAEGARTPTADTGPPGTKPLSTFFTQPDTGVPSAEELEEHFVSSSFF